MAKFFHNFFLSRQFIPHGHCYLWKSELVWLHVVSDLAIAIAYYSIPVMLVYFVYKRQNLPFNRIFLLFGTFIVACGTTHIMEVWTLWHPVYWLSGAIKAVTALVSWYTALELVPLLPKALVSSPTQLEAANIALVNEIAERERTEQALNKIRDELEIGVEERTVQLKKTNESLQAEIVERKRIESALLESEQRFRSTFEQAAVGIAHVAIDGRWLRVNQRLCDILGYTHEELTERTFQDITHPDDIDADLQYVRQVLKSEIETYSMEKRYICKDNSHIWVNLTVSLVRKRSGEPNYFLAVIQVIAERKQVEESLRERVRQQAVVADLGQRALTGVELSLLMDEAVALLAQSLAVEYCKVLKLLPDGKTLLLRAGVGWQEGLVGAWTVNAEADSQAGYILHTNAPVIVEDLCAETRFRGMPLLLDCGVVSGMSVSIGDAGQPFGVLGTYTTKKRTFTKDDIHFLQSVANIIATAIERKQVEEELRESEAQYRRLIETAAEGIWILDAEGKTTFANPRMAEMLSYSVDEMMGKSVFAFMNVEEQAIATKKLERRKQGIAEQHDFKFRRQDGSELWALICTNPIKNAVGDYTGTLGMITDITERKRIEQQIEASLIEKEVLLKEIHHRVKNNLQIVSSLLNLQAGYLKDEQAIEIFKVSQNRIETMALIHEKLYQSQDLASINFADYIQDLVSSLFASYELNSSTITYEINIDDVFLDLDVAIPGGLIVTELVVNSLKHAFPVGKEGKIRIGLHADGNNLTLLVGDNGIGLPQNFDFRKTESLGLQLVDALTSQLEGTIQLNTNSGVEFRIGFAA